MTAIKPLGKRVLVKRIEAQTTKGGIFLPESAQEKPKEGEVVAVGPEAEALKVGEKVLFSSYAGTEVKGGDEEFLILTEDEILGVLSGV
jgi:chaperonin GroES